MKRFFLYLVMSIAISATYAQSELPADTLGTPPDAFSGMNIPDGEPLLNVREYDGFLIDMNLMNPTAPTLPGRFSLSNPLMNTDLIKNFSEHFRLDPKAIYTQGNYTLGTSSFYGINPFGLSGFGNTTHLQMGSFTLKNGMKLNTYGEYDRNGHRQPNPSALPWQRNNFKGAFELKSANGNFGIRVEVQRGRESPF